MIGTISSVMNSPQKYLPKLSERATRLADLVRCHGAAVDSDYREILARAIGRHWRACTPVERLGAFAAVGKLRRVADRHLLA